MIWSKEETLPREEIEKIQLERLQETVNRVYNKVAPYRKKMDDAGVKPEDIKTLADLAKLPFVTKQDMRDNYPFGLFAVDRDELVRIHASSGTTGKPTVVGYTQGDLETWTECVSRIACMGGASSHDVAQICFGYGMFTGALGLHYGLENIGSTIVPSSTGNSQKQIMYMQDFETSLLVATPSYALRLAEVAREMGIEPARDLKVKIALVGSELLTDAMREEMHKFWGDEILITSNYGMSELMGPGVSGECLEHCGMHINEDYFIPEIIDPNTGEDLPDGETGEFVARGYNIMKGYYKMPAATASAIDKDGWLHTGDLACRNPDGNYRITGRLKDMIIRGGENIYPKEIEEFIYTHPEVKDVQVIGVPDEQYGEEIMACIVLKEGSALTVEEMRKYILDHMARHKVPKYIKFVDGFPMNAAGKILKYKMREDAVKELGLEKANSIVTA